MSSADLLSLGNSALMIFATLRGSVPLLWTSSFLMTLLCMLHSTCLNAIISQSSGTSIQRRIAGLNMLQFCVFFGALAGLIAASLARPRIPYWALLLLDAMTFVVSGIWTLCLVRRIHPAIASQNEGTSSIPGSTSTRVMTAAQSWKDGFKVAVSNPLVRKLVIAYCLTAIGSGVFESTVVAYQKTNLRFSDSLIAISRALNRVFGIAGVLFCSRNSGL